MVKGVMGLWHVFLFLSSRSVRYDSIRQLCTYSLKKNYSLFIRSKKRSSIILTEIPACSFSFRNGSPCYLLKFLYRVKDC
jgi:hypothetical protein